jgi:DNA-binding IclR family transcriptional regulator
MGLVKKDLHTQQYELTLRIADLARVALSQLDLVKIALPFMTDLVERCKESVFLVVMDGIETVTVAQVTAPRVLTARRYHVGRRYQASAVSGGKLLLAYGPQSLVDQVIGEGLEAYTKYTVTSPQEVLALLEKVRQDGYAVSDQELEIGLFAIATPIWDRDGEAIAAISISGPPERLSNAHLPKFIVDARQTSLQISMALGWPGPNGH